MTDVPFGKVPAWVGDENCPLSGAVEFGLIAILAARRAVRRRRFFYKGVEVWLEPGHVCVSQRDLAKRLEVDRQRIRTGLKNLEKLQILNPVTNPASNPANGPVPKVFFFNVDMQLDVFGGLSQPTNKPKRKPRNRPNSNPTATQQQPTSIDDKMERRLDGLGPAHAGVCEAEPRGQAPPPDQPDPKKFKISSDWTMDRDVETRLEQRFMPELGREGFWRQVERFVERHAEEGTLADQAGHQRNLEGWLERANANRDPPAKLDEQPKPKNGKALDLAPGVDISDFAERLAEKYDLGLAAQGQKTMTLVEKSKIKSAAGDLKLGKIDRLGLERGEIWTIGDALGQLGLAKDNAA